MNSKLWQSRDGRFWAERNGEQYKVQLGHVICLMPYSNDTEAINAVKKAYRRERRRISNAW
jgi:hypothetical protein